MTAKARKQRQEQKQRRRHQQIPCGDDEQKATATSNGEIQGSLHCAADGETVRRFGRDDFFADICFY
jgi:septal ring factor EnvC (AmiA/AmiB activator)